MGDFATNNGLCSPLIALLTSAGADAAAERNGLNFADMLAPFCTAQVTVKDPIGQQVNTRLRIDIRDVRRSGFLLSHTVLPHVIYEAIRSLITSSSVDGDEDAFSLAFANSFVYWFEPTEHDFLRSYLCCIFVVSAADQDPMEELNRLQYQQHLQQHGSSEASTSLSLPHCSAPKWMLPNILKYYVLIEDVSMGNSERAKQVFSAMTSKYGFQLCHLLCLNTSNCSNDMPDPWARLMEQRYRGLQSGLELAKRTLLAKSQALSEASQESDYSSISSQFVHANPTVLSRSSTGSSSLAIVSNSMSSPPSTASLFTTSSAATALHHASSVASTVTSNGYIPPNHAMEVNVDCPLSTLPLPVDFSPCSVSETSPAGAQESTPTIRGQCLDAADRERIRTFVEEFIRSALVPFIEKQLAAQNETLANRRSIGKSFSSMKKWLSAASSATTAISNSSIAYGSETSESQTRCLADMAFQFGLYSFALQLYQSLKKDFANDQAWLHHAGALEMAAVSTFLASYPPSLQSANAVPPSPAVLSNLQRNYPLRYMENAINYYLNVCLQPMLALRCVILSVEILTRLELFSEAASQLVRLNTNGLPELFGAVLLEHAGLLFQRAQKRRRMAFYSVLAGHRYSKSGLKQLSLACYQRALPLFAGKGWDFAEDHILFTLSSQNEFPSSPDFAIDCASRLLRHIGWQTPSQQAIFLAHYAKVLRKYSGDKNTHHLVVPRLDPTTITVFYGDALVQGGFGSSSTAHLASEQQESLLIWDQLEAALLQHHAYTGKEVSGSTLFADQRTDNSRELGGWSPALEPITVQLQLTNPLCVPLVLRRLRLGVSDVVPSSTTTTTPSDQPLLQEVSEVEELVLAPYAHNQEQTEGSSVSVDLQVTPTDRLSSFTIDSLHFDLCAPSGENAEDAWLTIPGFIPLKARGKRLFGTTEQRMTKVYAPDNRLKLRVCPPNHRWPLLDFRFAGSAGKKPRQQQQHVSAYCSQIYQIICQVENVGLLPVEHLYLGSDQPELVSLSEADESKEGVQWRLCKTSWVSVNSSTHEEEESKGILIHKMHNISPTRHCAVGQKFSLRLAFRAPSEPVAKPRHLYILFLYIGSNGASRQFRYRLSLSTQSLLAASLRAINPLPHPNGLCVLHLRNLISTRDSVLAKIELQRLGLVILEARAVQSSKQDGKRSAVRVVNTTNELDNRVGISIRPVSNRPVALDSDQSLNYCLYIQHDPTQSQSSELWLNDFVPDIPVWSHLLPAEEFAVEQSILLEHQRQAQLQRGMERLNLSQAPEPLRHLRLAVLWKANIANSNGTVATVFGENLLANPFGDWAQPRGLCTIPSSVHSTPSPSCFVLTQRELKELQDQHVQRSPADKHQQQRSSSAMSTHAQSKGF